MEVLQINGSNVRSTVHNHDKIFYKILAHFGVKHTHNTCIYMYVYVCVLCVVCCVCMYNQSESERDFFSLGRKSDTEQDPHITSGSSIPVYRDWDAK